MVWFRDVSSGRRLPLVHQDWANALLLEHLVGLVVCHPDVDPDFELDCALPAQWQWSSPGSAGGCIVFTGMLPIST